MTASIAGSIAVILILAVLIVSGCANVVEQLKSFDKTYNETNTRIMESMKDMDERMKDFEKRFNESEEGIEATRKRIEFQRICSKSEWAQTECGGDPPFEVMNASRELLGTDDVDIIKDNCFCRKSMELIENESDERWEQIENEYDFKLVCMRSDWYFDDCTGDPPQEVREAALRYLGTDDKVTIKEVCRCV